MSTEAQDKFYEQEFSRFKFQFNAMAQRVKETPTRDEMIALIKEQHAQQLEAMQKLRDELTGGSNAA